MRSSDICPNVPAITVRSTINASAVLVSPRCLALPARRSNTVNQGNASGVGLAFNEMKYDSRKRFTNRISANAGVSLPSATPLNTSAQLYPVGQESTRDLQKPWRTGIKICMRKESRVYSMHEQRTMSTPEELAIHQVSRQNWM